MPPPSLGATAEPSKVEESRAENAMEIKLTIASQEIRARLIDSETTPDFM
jgi:hypothetical protein